MIQQLTARMVRGYKGAAASILLLMLVEGRALSQAEMRRGTGYSNDCINDAVWMLRDDGLLIENGRYTWSLANGRQLPLGAAEPDPLQGDEAALGPNKSELMINESKNQSDSIDKDDSLIDEPAAPEKSDLAATDLQALGFYGRGVEELLAIPGLTLREVRYQVEHSPSLGAALSRIKRRQPVPEERDRASPGDRRRYIEGEFADFIEH